MGVEDFAFSEIELKNEVNDSAWKTYYPPITQIDFIYRLADGSCARKRIIARKVNNML